MEQYDQIGARLDRLPLARFHYRIFGIISFSLLLTEPPRESWRVFYL